MKRVLVTTALFAALIASYATRADDQGDRRAVVAGGEEIRLADSRFSQAELEKKRPHYRDLRPKKRR